MLPLYDNIRRRRIELGISQQELADKLGYTSRTTIAKIEAGVIDIPQSKIVEFAKALNISPGTLMGWTEPENKMFWQYTEIQNGKIVRKHPGLVNAENMDNALQNEQNSPLNLNITDDVISKDEQKLIFAYRSYSEFRKEVNKLLDEVFIDDAESALSAPTDKSAPSRTIKVAAYGGGVTDHEITATDEETKEALEESEDDQYIVKKNDWQ